MIVTRCVAPRISIVLKMLFCNCHDIRHSTFLKFLQSG